MSDFDKEAEREKLRERFEAEEEKREATEQMSELLLKGATMTNAHCSDCGDPVFRYDGQEFCPTCQKPISREEAEADDETETTGDGADDESGPDASGESGDHIEVANPSEEARVQFGGDDESAAADGEAGDEAPAGTDSPATGSTGEQTASGRPATEDPTAGRSEREVRETSQEIPSADPERTPAEAGGEQPAEGAGTDHAGTESREEDPQRNSARRQPSPAGRSTPSASTRTAARSESGGDVATDLAAAETALAQTVRRFAERAAATENPREAQDYLAAAREAAEALDATRR
ncbi:hypothetical protein KTS45_15660 [Halomicroarcula limicola]|uniref:Sjogrens syndrome scleroderma autoantigen 1 n=1 Tax=Haloarcula limicola TaxID=1429915 RepID=A0A8J7Y7R6_9EURY|nr:Sjogren's syndrome/scleroderma autoantigen 1 family protein [Halomicroarcula limicola]MBV0925642.1 hypothetical protein [Halomicroarcula limicola]